MTETSGFLSAAGDENVYSQLEWLASIRDIRTNGLVYGGTYNEFEVIEHTAPEMTVVVDTGEAWIQGDWYQSTASQDITIETADAIYPRIDRVVIRNNIIGSRKISVVVIKGEPAGSPVAPSYYRTSDTWDLVLADVAVAAGATTIVTANITDKRSDAVLCGESQPLAVRVSDIIVNDVLDMGGYKFSNVGLCTAANDAATYDYIEATTIPVGYICAFAGVSVPTGWLECAGSVYSAETYPDLYTQMGTTTLPDLRGRTPMGYDSTQTEFNAVAKTGGEDKHTLTLAEMPSHSHTGGWTYTNGTTFTMTGTAGYGSTAGGMDVTGSGTSHENRPPYMVMKWMIKAVA